MAPASPSSTHYRIFVGATAGVAAVVLLITQLIGGDAKTTAASAPASASGDEVRLESVDYVPSDAFTASVAATVTPPPEPTVSPDPARFPVQPASSGAVRSAAAGTVGLYGGSLNQASCDREQLVSFLESDTAKARAWVGALNSDPTLSWSGGDSLEVSEIRDYVFELTPVILRADTWVTNHGFSGGRATALQSLLQAGSAVLVDEYGVPRIRCYCGNPLLPPRRARPTFTGPRWDGFDPDRVLVVNASTTVIQNFVLTDVQTGRAIRRPAGTAGGGDVAGGSVEPSPSPTVEDPAGPDYSALVGSYSVLRYRGDPNCAAVENDLAGMDVLDASAGSIALRIHFETGESTDFRGDLSPDLLATVNRQFEDGSFEMQLQFLGSDTGTVLAQGSAHSEVDGLFSCNHRFTFSNE